MDSAERKFALLYVCTTETTAYRYSYIQLMDIFIVRLFNLYKQKCAIPVIRLYGEN